MNGYLLDTNVLSEFIKPHPNPDVIAWVRQRDPERLFISVITYGELRLGVEKLPAGKRRAELDLWLQTGFRGWFASDLIPITEEVVEHWARLTAAAKLKGITLATADGLIAATALSHSLTLATRNGKDFANLEIDLLNPWEQQAISSLLARPQAVYGDETRLVRLSKRKHTTFHERRMSTLSTQCPTFCPTKTHKNVLVKHWEFCATLP